MTRGHQLSDVYREMLEEAEARDPLQFHSDEQPIKRRRIENADPVTISAKQDSRTGITADTKQLEVQHVQTIYDTTSEEESDVEWEDVDIPQAAQDLPSDMRTSSRNDDTLQITLDQQPQSQRKTVRRRKAITAAEKKLRLDIHKTHVLCLLAHVHLRNLWCNDEVLQVRFYLPESLFLVSNLGLELFEANATSAYYRTLKSRPR